MALFVRPASPLWCRNDCCWLLLTVTILVFSSAGRSVVAFVETVTPPDGHRRPSSSFLGDTNGFSCLRWTSLTSKRKSLFGLTATASSTSSSAAADQTIQLTDACRISVGECIGSGSYGTVYRGEYHSEDTSKDDDDDDDDDTTRSVILKRPWSQEELRQRQHDDHKDRAQRCDYYAQVEDHCFSKLKKHPQLPPYWGRWKQTDDIQKDWMVFELVGMDGRPAKSLADCMKLDLEMNKNNGGDENQAEDVRRLQQVGRALGCTSDEETLDRVFESLLAVLEHVHSHNIVHRDVKPGNLLVSDGRVILIDFGSAADLDPENMGLLQSKYWGLPKGEARVAVSPIYCAPELYIDRHKAPLAFDLFSSGLLMCQLIFGYLEERVDAGFHQQLEDAQWDLNLWLDSELASKLRPEGLEAALEYLGNRPGLWSLLQRLLRRDPEQRGTASKALDRFQKIQKQAKSRMDEADYDKSATVEELDGPFFSMILESMEICDLPTVSRPLHFVATFSRKQTLGLVFSQVDGEDNENDPLWKEATKDAMPGEVFVQEVVPGGQADQLGIFEIGDRLQGIGELPFSTGGFERAVTMLQDQPPSATSVKLHFDRLSVRQNEAIPMIPSGEAAITIVDQGVWSTTGRRKTQEDAFVIHEIHDVRDRSILLMGVMDGHGGAAAAAMVSAELPGILSKEIIVNRRPLNEALLESWDTVCQSYRLRCENQEECIAAYDPKEGILQADTGSEDLLAGTTASMLAVDETNGRLVALNCGDSRSMVVTADGKPQLVTEDHTPLTEEERLREGVEKGLPYSLPKCKLSRWTISAGKYEYAVGRSLEGPFVTSKGIVSDADVTTTQIAPGETLVSATDGLWEVMDSVEVAMDLKQMRQQGLSARDAARTLCSMAMKKGTPDNVSAVVVYV